MTGWRIFLEKTPRHQTQPTDRVISRALRFVRFSHTIFALPFALGSMFVAAEGWPSWRAFFLVLLAMVFARTAAMTFNRLADWQIDQCNPRTAERHKLISYPAALCLLGVSSGAFAATTFFINEICFVLSPVALAIVFFYSLTKRFTSLSHFFLGFALAVAPVGAWLAVRPVLDWAPLVLALAVLVWVAGFDLIYATQDYDFDRRENLRSLVVRLGISKSLVFAQWLHCAMLALLICFGLVARLGVIYFVSLMFVLAALLYEHVAARELNIRAVNRAFFLSNAIVGNVFLAGTIADVMLA
jgi:4-hydroxybenzoate polyprenyltransferase